MSAIRRASVTSVLQKTDRILGVPDATVRFNPSNVAPGWTDGKNIFLSESIDPLKDAIENGFTPETTMLVTGLNYHELAHCLYTPRIYSGIGRWARDNGYFFEFNVLEDQSAETLFVKKYEPAMHYFTGLVTTYMLKPEYLKSNYVLVSGRLFLPSSIRMMLRNSYEKQSILDDIDRVVATYKTLTYPKDVVEMEKAIKEFHELLQDQGTSLAQMASGIISHDDMTESGIENKEIRQLKKEPEVTKEDDEDDNDQSQATSGSGADGDQDDADQEDGDETSPQGSAQPYQRDPDEVTEKEFKEHATSVFDEALEEVIQEVEDRIESFRQEERSYRVDLAKSSRYDTEPPGPEVTIVSRCIEEFNDVKVQHTPGRYQGQRHGKLNPRHYARALQGDEHVFKRWREGVHDALDFEVVFLLDLSSSMYGRIDRASRSLWVLKRTFEDLDGMVSVLGFSDDTFSLFPRGERASADAMRIFHTMGGTLGKDAFIESRRVLRTSVKTLKIVVCISDGGFNDVHEVSDEIDHFEPGSIVMVGIDYDMDRWENRPQVLHTQTITDPAELVDVVKNIALRLSNEHVQKKGML